MIISHTHTKNKPSSVSIRIQDNSNCFSYINLKRPSVLQSKPVDAVKKLVLFLTVS